MSACTDSQALTQEHHPDKKRLRTDMADSDDLQVSMIVDPAPEGEVVIKQEPMDEPFSAVPYDESVLHQQMSTMNLAEQCSRLEQQNQYLKLQVDQSNETAASVQEQLARARAEVTQLIMVIKTEVLRRQRLEAELQDAVEAQEKLQDIIDENGVFVDHLVNKNAEQKNVIALQKQQIANQHPTSRASLSCCSGLLTWLFGSR